MLSVHENTLKSIVKIEEILKKIHEFYTTTYKKIEEIRVSPIYNENFKDEKICKLKEEYINFASNFNDDLYELSKAIEETELAAVNALDLTDTLLTNALTTINSFKEELPAELQQSISEQMKGNYAAQRFLKPIYEKYSYTNVHLDDFRKADTDLKTAINSFVFDGKKDSSITFQRVVNACNTILENICSNHIVDLGIKDIAFLENVAKAAGVFQN